MGTLVRVTGFLRNSGRDEGMLSLSETVKFPLSELAYIYISIGSEAVSEDVNSKRKFPELQNVKDTQRPG